MRREFAHDVMAALVSGDDVAQGCTTGTPIMLEWGNSSQEVTTLAGYVHHTEPMAAFGKANMVKIVLIGASYILKQPQQQAWQLSTIPAVIRALADSVKFSGDIKPHAQVWPMLTQGGKPTWDFMVSLAKQIGWFLYANSTDIQFHPYLDDIGGARTSALSFSAKSATPSIKDFRAVSGEQTPDGGAKADRQLAGIDIRSGTLFQAADDGTTTLLDTVAYEFQQPSFRLYDESPASTYGEAVAVLDGATQANRWHIQAQAEVTGSARLVPGTLVALEGISRRQDGYWYVQSAEHSSGKDDYVTHLLLGRDSDWDQYVRPDPRRRKVVRQRLDPFGTLTTAVPPAKLINNLWRAAYSPRPNSG